MAKILKTTDNKILVNNSKVIVSDAATTGETWVINETPSVLAGYLLDEGGYFNCNGYQYLDISIGYRNNRSKRIAAENYICYGDMAGGGGTNVYIETWVNQAYRTVTFATAPTGNLLTWIQANAVKQ